MSTITLKDSKFANYSSLLLRMGLGVGFLSAVADRFGLWGAFGQPNVDWGNFSRFLEYTHTLNWYLPAGMIPLLGIVATGAEILLGLLLVIGWRTRTAALLSGVLLSIFGVAMTLSLGIKAPLNYAVFTGIGGSLLLASCEGFAFSVDEFLVRRSAHRLAER
ncbi:MauE/DoxX family redox-associated membrane protein [Granulicella mallensis]|uniref:Putative membrane protein YphA (DoxX/SURF4 family) n=1 Tax=Granulicella mallensis TaxID=940614 RepID=A0A7W7ZUP7_9BACT|nr:MauE/DoxX family redox-associated membrane protein [Granulicella mallensis]MBB5066471.1 putative membrane protein YphA (DoxX/SURF4 family) [Granulicella mallensis]